MEILDEIWTGILEFISQIVTPPWGDLIAYIPLLLFGLIGLVVLVLVVAWRRAAAPNRPRIATRLPQGRKPPDVHLPGPSPWPFVGAAGLGVMLFALVMGLDEVPNLVLLAIGTGIGVVGLAGWLIDASREYRHVEAGEREGHGPLLTAAERAVPLPLPGGTAGRTALGGGPVPAERRDAHPEIPEGIHLPGPSAWPFLAPIGLAVALFGLIFGPALLIGGLIMGAVASVGWLLESGREYRQVEAHGHAEPATRDPEKAFPKVLVPVYLGIAGIALAITILPAAFALFPGAGTGDGDGGIVGPEPTNTPYLSASTAVDFEQDEIAVFADEPFSLTFENKQVGVPHNVAIWDSAALNTEYFQGEIFDGEDTRVYEVPPLPAGEYWFICTVHPNMAGTLYVR
jgi:plastocyanin